MSGAEAFFDSNVLIYLLSDDQEGAAAEADQEAGMAEPQDAVLPAQDLEPALHLGPGQDEVGREPLALRAAVAEAPPAEGGPVEPAAARGRAARRVLEAVPATGALS